MKIKNLCSPVVSVITTTITMIMNEILKKKTQQCGMIYNSEISLIIVKAQSCKVQISMFKIQSSYGFKVIEFKN
ncbi:hypothetical protein [Clostridium botulinum]|uniref:hypothetical protein n=2 Tax=Clostridium botulinum TaxID=1491 RepID=UPI001146BD48|nr:hypothetical protein [Clostridium botulinum]QPW62030.1 hypothetical protein IG390_14350 [Clostridium botulinum]